jgi:hypothetical protein
LDVAVVSRPLLFQLVRSIQVSSSAEVRSGAIAVVFHDAGFLTFAPAG